MKKIELKHILDDYEERASWTYTLGYHAPDEISELHKICDVELEDISDEDEIPLNSIKHIDEVASHYENQWSDIAADTLREIEHIIHR